MSVASVMHRQVLCMLHAACEAVSGPRGGWGSGVRREWGKRGSGGREHSQQVFGFKCMDVCVVA